MLLLDLKLLRFPENTDVSNNQKRREFGRQTLTSQDSNHCPTWKPEDIASCKAEILMESVAQVANFYVTLIVEKFLNFPELGHCFYHLSVVGKVVY